MPAILEVDNIAKSFGGVRAVDGASFRLAMPGIYGLIGPNGAGKTTLFDVICGRQFADTGAVSLAGERIDHMRVHQRARLGLARTFQECRVLEQETCLDNVLFAAQDKHLSHELFQAASRGTLARQSVADEAPADDKIADADDWHPDLAAAPAHAPRCHTTINGAEWCEKQCP